jgi:glycosyltransferase involved in cell wall biosynthesis
VRFAFVTIGPFSGVNDRVLAGMREEFPQLEAERFDVPGWIRSDRRAFATNLAHVLAEHGPRPFLERRRRWGVFYRTRYMFHAIRTEMARRLALGDYAFTFQTQSLFDASVPGTPNFVYTDHTELVNRTYPGFDAGRPPSARWISHEREIYEHATKVFTMSSHVARSLQDEYGLAEERGSCVGVGCSLPEERLLAIEPDYAGKRILFVGREWERKGGPDLLRAFERVRAREPDATLAIAGCSPQVSGAGVEVLGPLTQTQVAEQYARSAVYCMPTLREPFGVVFVEALMSALPVVSTTVGALPDIVQNRETGYLVAPGDVTALARAIDLLISTPGRARRFGERGREYVAGRYTWRHTVASMAEQIRAAAPGLQAGAGARRSGDPERGQARDSRTCPGGGNLRPRY